MDLEIILGKKASELDKIFEAQSNEINANPELKFERNVCYALVECDTELKRIPLNANSIGLKVKADPDMPGELDESFIFSLLLVTGTINHCTIDVPSGCTIKPEVVLSEAEAQGLNVRLLLPEEATSIELVRDYAETLCQYATLWIQMQSGSFSLAPVDGYMEYKFLRALGYEPKVITTNYEMQVLFSETLGPEAMDFIKERLDHVFERELGGDEFFKENMKFVGSAIHLKNTELRNARSKMLEQELDTRTPVPNLIRTVNELTGLGIVDSAGLVYEIKRSIHLVLDKYLPATKKENERDVPAAQLAFAEQIGSLLTQACGGKENLLKVWDQISTASQLKQTIDLDRGVVAPSEAAERAAKGLNVDGKVVALAGAEFAGLFGSILRAGKVIDKIGLEKPKPVAEPKSSNIIAVG